MDLTAASRTGVGREASEDRWVAVNGDHALVLAVADGMGGTIGGGEAATAALAALLDQLDGSAPVTLGTLGAAVAAAHQRVRALAPDGMPVALRAGTTLTAAVATGHRLHLAHVGDSSCWLLRRGRLRRLTEVHTHAAALVAAGAVERGSPAERRLGGLLTRFLGMPGPVAGQLSTVRLRPGDRVLVATDGVTGALPVPALAELLSRPGGAAEVVRAAVAAGGRDDATAVLVDVDTLAPSGNTRHAGGHAGGGAEVPAR
ncbi:MAG: PP2C family protein-serine/threonine phosphatase [Mycobacteriales bacterium]